MLIIKTATELQKVLGIISEGRAIGFAPTMGALHMGHLSLLKMAKSEGCITVASIFVNPTQFNDPNDLNKYPRTFDADVELLIEGKCDVLFYPSVEEVYPNGMTISNQFDFGDLAYVMEGAFRPGHFDGMAQVVNRLLEMIQPHRLYMGQKDFQQLTIVRRMLKLIASNIELISCPTLREPNGLAMSSRNTRLSEEQREAASFIYQQLKRIDKYKKGKSLKQLCHEMLENLTIPDFKPEYVQSVDGISLAEVDNYTDSEFIVVCVACWVGSVRLIDNLIIKQNI